VIRESLLSNWFVGLVEDLSFDLLLRLDWNRPNMPLLEDLSFLLMFWLIFVVESDRSVFSSMVDIRGSAKYLPPG
jgi:hypothetical protein